METSIMEVINKIQERIKVTEDNLSEEQLKLK